MVALDNIQTNELGLGPFKAQKVVYQKKKNKVKNIRFMKMFTMMKSIAVYGKLSMAGNPIQSLNVCKWSRFLGVKV